MRTNKELASKNAWLAVLFGALTVITAFKSGSQNQKAEDEDRIKVLEKDLERAERRRYDHNYEYDQF